MNESGIRVGYIKGEYIIIPIEVKEIYTASPENRKSITIIETIIADRKEPPPLFIITPGKKIMDNWIAEELTGKERVNYMLIGYINNKIAL